VFSVENTAAKEIKNNIQTYLKPQHDELKNVGDRLMFC